MSELKICPFCGGEAEILKDNECWGHGEFAKRVTIRCKKCSVRLSVSNLNSEIAIKHKAIEAWNTRKPMDRIVKRLEAMQDNLPAELSHCHEFYVEGMFEGLNRGIKIVIEEGGLNAN
jgi:Lar family restriction alleviation protein